LTVAYGIIDGNILEYDGGILEYGGSIQKFAQWLLTFLQMHYGAYLTLGKLCGFNKKRDFKLLNLKIYLCLRLI
jgi:hypothetical protein